MLEIVNRNKKHFVGSRIQSLKKEDSLRTLFFHSISAGKFLHLDVDAFNVILMPVW